MGWKGRPNTKSRCKHPSAHPFIATLRNARITQSRTQLDLAIRVGCTRNGVLYWESGRRSPTLHNLIAWANALGFDITLRRLHELD